MTDNKRRYADSDAGRIFEPCELNIKSVKRFYQKKKKNVLSENYFRNVFKYIFFQVNR